VKGRPAVRRRRLAAAGVLLLPVLPLLSGGCAARAFSPASPEAASRAASVWDEALRRAPLEGDANLLYDAALSQGVLSTHGTLALKLRGEAVSGTLAGPLGAPIATYADGVLRGEKLEPVRLPEHQLRALLAGVWREGDPEIAGQRGSEVLLRWPDRPSSDGILDLDRGELMRLTVRRAEGELEARYSGARAPWPEAIEIDEKRTGSRLKLKLLGSEAPP
jgi:hypothetical protein